MTLRLSARGEGGDGDLPFLQSDFWARFKSAFGWSALRLVLELEDGEGAPRGCGLLVLVRRMPGGFCFAYAPHGPAIELRPERRSELLARLSEAMRPLLPPGCLFVRYDPPWYETETIAEETEGGPVQAPSGGGASAGGEPPRPTLGPPLRRARADVQPPDTVLVDLGPGEPELLAAMKSKWRYNIRLAERKGVVVEESGAEAVPEFYELYRETSRRDKIALHPEAYYRSLFALAEADRGAGREGSPAVKLWVARHEGQALAAIITLFRRDEAVYLYGASSDEKRNLMPAYALQWAAMRAAKAAGCLRYDLFGIPPSDDPSHPMAGLYRFKTGFGGAIAHRAGSWDYPLAPAAYLLFRAAEAARSWYFKVFRKKLRQSAPRPPRKRDPRIPGSGHRSPSTR